MFKSEAAGVAFYPSREVAMGFPEHRPEGAAEAERGQDQIVQQEALLPVLKPVALFMSQQARAAVGRGPYAPRWKANGGTLGPETNRDAVDGEETDRPCGSFIHLERLAISWI